MTPPDIDRTALPTLLSATLYLMSAFAANGCPRLAIMVRKHLDILTAHADTDPLLRSTCVQLVERHWAQADANARKAIAAHAHAPDRTGAILH
jgi:hypothetical protein